MPNAGAPLTQLLNSIGNNPYAIEIEHHNFSREGCTGSRAHRFQADPLRGRRPVLHGDHGPGGQSDQAGAPPCRPAAGEPARPGQRFGGHAELPNSTSMAPASACPHWLSAEGGQRTGSPAVARVRWPALGGRARAPLGTTRLPVGGSASSAATARPVGIRSIARLCPISRGRRTVPPSISGTPTAGRRRRRRRPPHHRRSHHRQVPVRRRPRNRCGGDHRFWTAPSAPVPSGRGGAMGGWRPRSRSP